MEEEYEVTGQNGQTYIIRSNPNGGWDVYRVDGDEEIFVGYYGSNFTVEDIAERL